MLYVTDDWETEANIQEAFSDATLDIVYLNVTPFCGLSGNSSF